MTSRPHARSSSAPWLARVAASAQQQPLVDTRLSLASLRRADPTRPPQAVYLGVGLCAREELSRAVPLDLLGVLLPAEAIRRAAGARELLVLIADRHALENGFSPAEVEERAQALEATLVRIRERCGLDALSIVRASEFHSDPAYRAALASVRRRAGASHHDYALRQLADAIYLDGDRGALLKVGWALRGAAPFRRRDEIAFDRALRAVGGDLVSFAYCKPGRSLADDAPRVPPYVVRRPEARLCIDRREDAAAKLAIARDRASPDTLDGCRRHLRALLYTYGRLVEPLPRGPLEARAAALVGRLGPARFGPATAADADAAHALAIGRVERDAS